MGDVLFAFLPECECDYARQCIHVYTCEQEAASVQPATWAMLLPLEGVNHPALSLIWDVSLSLYKTGPQKPLTSTVSSCFARHLKSRFVFMIYTTFVAELRFPSLLSPSCSLYLSTLLFFSQVKHKKTLCYYCLVSRASKSLQALPQKLQAQPGAPYLGLCALGVSSGTRRHRGGKLEG